MVSRPPPARRGGGGAGEGLEGWAVVLAPAPQVLQLCPTSTHSPSTHQ